MDRGKRQNGPPQAIPFSLRPSGNRRQARVTAGPECPSGQWCAQEGPGRSRRSERVREAGQSKRLPEHTQEVIENQGNEGKSARPPTREDQCRSLPGPRQRKPQASLLQRPTLTRCGFRPRPAPSPQPVQGIPRPWGAQSDRAPSVRSSWLAHTLGKPAQLALDSPALEGLDVRPQIGRAQCSTKE